MKKKYCLLYGILLVIGNSSRIEHPKPELSDQAIPEIAEHIIPVCKYQNTNTL